MTKSVNNAFLEAARHRERWCNEPRASMLAFIDSLYASARSEARCLMPVIVTNCDALPTRAGPVSHQECVRNDGLCCCAMRDDPVVYAAGRSGHRMWLLTEAAHDSGEPWSVHERQSMEYFV
jgi:hypothetical protein